MTKLDRKAPKPNNLEILGQCLIDAGHEIGSLYQYCKKNSFVFSSKRMRLYLSLIVANILLKVGEAEKRLGLNEKEFVNKSSDCLLQPLKSFLEGQMKTIQVRQIKCQNSICIVATY